MTTALTFSLCERLNPLHLAGPLLDKELRVSSRRRQTYLLRVGYIAIMAIFALAAWCWIMSIPRANTTTFGASRSAEVGLRVTANILWFQFMAAQLIAAVMLSSSMGDEIRRGGLSVLLTTPVTSVQIVLGKLLSRMWQVVLLLTISLPALAIIRVMGGISWVTVTGSFCVTLTAALFVGALCLWLSTYCRYPYQVISTAVAVYLGFFIALPAVISTVTAIAGLDEALVSSIVSLLNPRSALFACLYPTWYARTTGLGNFYSWPLHCLIMLALTMAILGLSAWRIRRVSIQSLGLTAIRKRRRVRLDRCPVVWRELAGTASRWRWGTLFLLGGAVATSALLVAGRIFLGRRGRFYSYARDIAWVFWMIALLRLAVLAAGAIAREKEGGTLSLLLTTPLDEKRIVRGKLRAVVDRGIPWVLAAVVVQMGYFASVITLGETLGVACYFAAILASAFFVTTAGLYFGARLKTTAAAVVTTLGIHLFLRHVVGGSYNPIYVWLRYKALMASRGSGMVVMLFNYGTLLAVILLQVGLGVSMLRRTPGILRRYV